MKILKLALQSDDTTCEIARCLIDDLGRRDYLDFGDLLP